MAKLAANSLEGKAEQFVKRIEALHKELDSEKGEYMARCKELREDVKEIYSEAKTNDVPKNALRGIVKQRELQRKIDAIPNGFEPEDAQFYERLVEALGPLGQAAADKAGFKKELQDGIKKGDELAKGGIEQVGRGKIGTAPSTAQVVN